jgi:hypothetical protein
VPPVVDDALDECDALADVPAFVVDFALADDDGLFVGVDEAVDTWACAEAEFEQLELAVGWPLFLADLLGLGLVLEDVVGVADTEPPGLALGVTLPLGLELALPDGLVLALMVLPLLVLPLEDVAGAVVVAVVLLGELLLVGVADACVDGDGQALNEDCPAAAELLDGAFSATEGAGLTLEVAVLALLEGLLMLRAEPMASPTFIIAWRAGGTTDRTTPTANTAAPTANAGRSMASRQSLGRRGSRRSGACRCGTRKPRRRISLAATPEMPSQTPRIQLGWLACAGRDRILSRIRSRPSEPGST